MTTDPAAAPPPTGTRRSSFLAGGVGALFVRSFERGERVHLAMRSRGYTGRMPLLSTQGATSAQWLEGLTISLAAVLIAIAVRLVSL